MLTKREYAAIASLTIITIFLLFSIYILHPFGDPNAIAMDQYVIDHTINETGANNGVTSVVFDYRGFDTLGEATILFTAVAGVIMIFRRLKL